MTEQQIDRDELLAWRRNRPGDDGLTTMYNHELRYIVDALDQAEAELDSWMTRTYEAEGKLWKAEARIKAVQDMLGQPADDTEGMDSTSAHYANGYELALQDIRRALEGGEHDDPS